MEGTPTGERVTALQEAPHVCRLNGRRAPGQQVEMDLECLLSLEIVMLPAPLKLPYNHPVTCPQGRHRGNV